MYMRLLRADGQAGEPGSPLKFLAASPGKKRDGYDTATLPWLVDNYRANPVVTWVHDFGGERLPIGRGSVAIDETPAGETLQAEVLFDVVDPFAAEVDRKYRAGYLHAVSVSWDDVDEDGIPTRNSGKKAVAHDLLEIAAVPVPGDPQALQGRQVTALRALRADLDAVLGDNVPPPAPALLRGVDPSRLGLGQVRREVAEAESERLYQVEYNVADGERAITGSYEDLADRVLDAIKATGLFMGHCYVMATFADSVVLNVYSEDYDSCRVYLVAYTAAGGAITVGDWLPVRFVQDIEGLDGSAVRLAVDGDDPWVSAATAMVDVFTRGSGDPDERRLRAYRALLGHYRRAKRTPPEWLESAELDALDDANWRALFVAGELEVAAACRGDGARVGAELSARNLTEFGDAIDAIDDGAKRIRAVLDRVREAKSSQTDGSQAVTLETAVTLDSDVLERLHSALTRKEKHDHEP